MGLESGTTISDLFDNYPLPEDKTNQGDDHLRLIKQILKDQFPGISGDGFNVAITATEQEINWLGGLTSNVQNQFDAITTRLSVLEGALIAPVGTAMTFYNDNVPAGWTKQIANNNYMLRIVTDLSGGTAGNTSGDSPILNNKVPTHNHTATSANESANHTHSGTSLSTGNESVTHTHTFNGTTNVTGSHIHGSRVWVSPTHHDVPGGGSGYVIEKGWNGGEQQNTDLDGDHSHTVTGTNDNASADHSHSVSGNTGNTSASHNHAITVNNNSGNDWAPKYLNAIIGVKD